MGTNSQVEKRQEKESDYEIQTGKDYNLSLLEFWKNDQQYLRREFEKGKPTTRFWLYKGVVFTNRSDIRCLICRATETDRYEQHKDIIDAAIQDLTGRQDGIWYFNASDKWYREPLPEVLTEALKVET